jgi:hypothetical protein
MLNQLAIIQQVLPFLGPTSSSMFGSVRLLNNGIKIEVNEANDVNTTKNERDVRMNATPMRTDSRSYKEVLLQSHS